MIGCHARWAMCADNDVLIFQICMPTGKYREMLRCDASSLTAVLALIFAGRAKRGSAFLLPPLVTEVIELAAARKDSSACAGSMDRNLSLRFHPSRRAAAWVIWNRSMRFAPTDIHIVRIRYRYRADHPGRFLASPPDTGRLMVGSDALGIDPGAPPCRQSIFLSSRAPKIVVLFRERASVTDEEQPASTDGAGSTRVPMIASFAELQRCSLPLPSRGTLNRSLIQAAGC